MRILLPSQDIAFLDALNEIESWDMALVPYNLPGRDICFEQNFWLGSSRDGKVWVLAAVPFDILLQSVLAAIAISPLGFTFLPNIKALSGFLTQFACMDLFL